LLIAYSKFTAPKLALARAFSGNPDKIQAALREDDSVSAVARLVALLLSHLLVV
jgi:hypothetical protein